MTPSPEYLIVRDMMKQQINNLENAIKIAKQNNEFLKQNLKDKLDTQIFEQVISSLENQSKLLTPSNQYRYFIMKLEKQEFIRKIIGTNISNNLTIKALNIAVNIFDNLLNIKDFEKQRRDMVENLKKPEFSEESDFNTNKKIDSEGLKIKELKKFIPDYPPPAPPRSPRSSNNDNFYRI